MPLEEFKQKLEIFDREYLNFSVSELDRLFEELGVGDVTYGFNLSPHLCLFRGIKCNSKSNFVSEISYPPSSIARPNRANQRGESLFYCSSSKEAVFYELDLKSGDRIVLSSWIVQEPILIDNLSFMIPNISRFGLIKNLDDGAIEKSKGKIYAGDL